jgi:hypothetical protein
MKFVSVVQGKPYNIVIEPDSEHEGIFILTVDGDEVSTEVVELKPTSITMGISNRIGFYEYSRVRGRLAEVNLGYQSYEVQIKTPQQEQLEHLLAKFAKAGECGRRPGSDENGERDHLHRGRRGESSEGQARRHGRLGPRTD